jgi:hypothetical protein
MDRTENSTPFQQTTDLYDERSPDLHGRSVVDEKNSGVPKLPYGTQNHIEDAGFRGEPDGGVHIGDSAVKVLPVFAQWTERPGEAARAGQGTRSRDAYGTGGATLGGIGCPASREERVAGACWL